MPPKINCLAIDDEPVALDILATHLSKIERLNLLQTCSNATDAFNYLSLHEVDLIFLDINMPGISGIAFAKAINPQTKIIFTTAYREYAVAGFDLQAVDYLLKPISYARLLMAVEKYLELYQKPPSITEKTPSEADFIFLKSDRQMVKLSLKDLYFIESLSDYIKIYNTGKMLTIREKISVLEEKLPAEKFLRVHRSYVIALAHIESYTHEQLVIKGHSIPISRTYKEAVLQKLGEYH